MLAERRRALRLLSDRSLAPLWVAWVADRAGDWIVLLTLLVGGRSWFLEPMLSAWIFIVWLAPRLVVEALYGGAAVRASLLSWHALAIAKAVLLGFFLWAATTRAIGDTELLLTAAGVFGFSAALAARARADVLRRSAKPADLGAGVATASFVARAAVLIGAGVAGGMVLIAPSAVLWFVAGGAFISAALLAASVRGPRSSQRPRAPTQERSFMDPDETRRFARTVVLYLVTAFGAGAVGAVLILATLSFSLDVRSATTDQFVSLAPLLVAAIGLGLVLGPLPVPRLLLRVPAPLLVLVLTSVICAVVVAIAITQSAAVALGGLVVFGLASSTLDTLCAIALRRLVPVHAFTRATRISLLALTFGQLYGLLSVVTVGATDASAIAAVLAIAQVALVGLAVALGGRSSLQGGGLSSLPIKSVVHKLSWDTRPAAEPAYFSGAEPPEPPEPGEPREPREPRVQRLAKWITRHVALERLRVTLPVSGREYDIYRPADESRERLFEQGRADAEKQMPYWAKVWPSGVALADVVVERREEVAHKHVLELGAGLGVTACAVLEYGGQIVTADYSALPLAHCRMNTLVNTGRAPRATCFNWRHDSEVKAALKQPAFSDGFPLIIAGDVLYEGRDAEPLLNVIDRMLVAEGSLWLAEPVRRTAQRFLDSAALLGWEIESRQVKAEWPDVTDGPVNLHFLRRSAEPDPVAADLGGMRI